MEYSNDVSGFNRGMGNIAQAIMQRPALRAAAQRQAMQGQVAQSQIDVNNQRKTVYSAEAQKLAAQLDDLKMSGKTRAELQTAVQEAAPYIQNGQMDHPSVAKLAGIAAKVAADNKGHPMAEMMQSLGVPTPDKKYAEDTRAESSKYSADTKATTDLAKAGLNKYRTASPGSSIFNQQDGTVTKDIPSAARERAEYDATHANKSWTEIIPEKPADITPAKPSVWHLMGKNEPAVPAVTNSPAVPAQTNHYSMKVPMTQQVAPQAAPQQGVRVRNKQTGQTFIYKGNSADVPRDQFDLIP